MTTKPYGLISDLHAHNWSSFASLDSEGRNTRLMAIVHELNRCCDETLKAGGHTVVIAGDLFHTRGSVDPSVFNPIKECMETRAIKDKIFFLGIAGNHDLKDKESKTLGSSVSMLGRSNGQHIFFHHEPYVTMGSDFKVAFVPWFPTPARYLEEIKNVVRTIEDRGESPLTYDLVCHIGIDGTIKGMPDHGVTPEKLADYDFHRVFSGHYHHHRRWDEGDEADGTLCRVYSIGAPTHHTWSDVGTDAGFMVVHHDREQWFASHAPSFIDVTGEEDPEELPFLVDGHFVRVRSEASSGPELTALRQTFTDMGVKGVLIQSVPSSATTKRAGVSAKSLSSLDKSVTDYTTEKGMRPRVALICAEILAEART